jgi:hypothetical protein
VSRTLDLFISSELPVDQLVERLRLAAGGPDDVAFVRPRHEWLLVDGPVLARLHEHDYGDDRDLALSRYRWAITCRIRGGIAPDATPEWALLRRLGARLSQQPGTAVLMVIDLEDRVELGSPGPDATGVGPIGGDGEGSRCRLPR